MSIITDKGKKLQHADEYYQITQEIIQIRDKGEVLIYELAKRLKVIRDKELWKTGGYESFYSYLAQPEMSFDRRSVLFWIQIYETFIEKYALNPGTVNKIGWTKLARIVPHVTDDNYKYYFEKAKTLSRSDLERELVEHHLITLREPEIQHVECPKCHYVFNPKKRREVSFNQEDYNQVIRKYEEVKETKFEGKEYDPIMQAVKTMFLNGRTPEEIIATIEFLGDQDDYSWTINTVVKKIAEILPQLNIKKEPMSELDKEWFSK